MSDYIDRETVYPLAKKICDVIDSEDFQRLNFGMRILDWIDDIPAADVRPVVRGHWIPTGQDEEFYGELNKCSVCGAVDIGFGDYCFNCGARMEGEE